MEVGLNRTGFSCYDKIFSQTRRCEESRDTVVPDTMPDVAEIVESSGCLMIRSKDVDDGGVRLSASVEVSVVYRPEGEEGVRALEVSVPVSLSLEDENISRDCQCCAVLTLLSVDAKLLNPRKVTARAELSAAVDCYRRVRREVCVDTLEGTEGVYIQKRSVDVTPTVSVREKTFVLTDEITIPASQPAAEELLSRRVSIETGDIKSVGGKLIFQGSAQCSLLYRGIDAAVAEAAFSTNFSQMIETDSDCDEPDGDITLTLTGAYFEISSSGDGRVITMETHILAQSVCTQNMELGFIADAYSNSHPLELTSAESNWPRFMRREQLRENIREELDTPGPAVEVLGAFALPGTAEITAEGVKLPISVSAIYRGGDGVIHGIRRRIETKLPLTTGEGESVGIECVQLSELYVSPASETLEVRAHVEVTATVTQTRSITAVESISLDESVTLDNSKQPSLVILRASSDDDLWRLAKENRSTVELISEVNSLEEAEGNWEKYLLIPKTR